MSTLARNIFEAWDANGDGVLDLDELRAGLARRPAAVTIGRENEETSSPTCVVGLAAITDGDDVAVAASAGAILAELDEDGDGTISLAEFEERAEQACRQFVPSPVGLGDAATRGYAGPGAS